ncbi:hypothetical protein LPW11_22270 [Geomonas sp. RF6]|uniref:hypothetical protein n=1 Tax=Geomonas sp. RF6 TaxID=2897342 RepID=UPI001E408E4E|nr:hypothetical protein [Geomonas sp. RF6]UFS70578.1 hypothetical protein LPW11_22270 [Geomonas sp. RF6]
MNGRTGGTSSGGSGSAHGDCCGSSLLATVQKALEEGEFFEEEADAAAERLAQANRTGIDDFQGLSPEQMYRMIYFPFDSPEIVTFPTTLDVVPEAPIIDLFTLLAEALGPDGVKPTVTGKLPRKLCQDTIRAYLGEEEYRKLTSVGEILREVEFSDLHVLRIVAEMAGLIRRYKGKFILGRECRKVLAEEGGAGIYPRLLMTYLRHFNWGYGDTWAGTPSIQQFFLFSLFLLQKYGDQWQGNSFYEDLFMRAFPRVVEEVLPQGQSSPEEVLRRCYSRRFFGDVCRRFGLVEIARVEWAYSEFRLRKRPLLESAVKFHLPGLL